LHLATSKALAILLVVVVVAGQSPAQSHQSQAQSRAIDASERNAILESVIRAELQGTTWSAKQKLCLAVDGDTPDRQLLIDLRQRGLNRHEHSACTGRTGTFSRSLRINSSEGDRAQVTAEVADNSLREVDFGVLVRKGTYPLIRQKEQWTVERSNATRRAAGRPLRNKFPKYRQETFD
jgi:hypothetical protein